MPRRVDRVVSLADRVTAERSLSDLLTALQARELRAYVLASALRDEKGVPRCRWAIRKPQKVSTTDASGRAVCEYVVRDYGPIPAGDSTWSPPNGAAVRLVRWDGDLRELRAGRPTSALELSYTPATRGEFVALIKSTTTASAVRNETRTSCHPDLALPEDPRIVSVLRPGKLRLRLEDLHLVEESDESKMHIDLRSESERSPSADRSVRGGEHEPGWKPDYRPADKARDIRSRAVRLLWTPSGEHHPEFWRGRAPNMSALAAQIAEDVYHDLRSGTGTRTFKSADGGKRKHAAGYSQSTVREVLKHVVLSPDELTGPPSRRR